MVNKRKTEEEEAVFNDDFPDTSSTDVGPIPDPVLSDPALDNPIPSTDVCLACNGTGAVPENLIAGKVDKWKDCPMCVGTGQYKPEPKPEPPVE